MAGARADVIAAGHICLDVIPAFRAAKGGVEQILVPGKLVDVGPAITATGGPVSNVGLALHRLGLPARLMGKVGDDSFGVAILEFIRQQGADLADGMIVAPGEHSSYTIVISLPGVDRIFLHCPGANDTFGVEDVPPENLEGVRLFHFGYPPLMRRMFEDDGETCASLFRLAKERGLTTSLDMAKPDPDSPAGRADWPAFLRRVLPFVDVFLPSVDEILYMVDRPTHDRFLASFGPEELLAHVNGDLLAHTAETLIRMGAAVVALKLGERGLYLRTTDDASRLADTGAWQGGEAWQGRELYAPCFRTEVVGTTGSGDATIAGVLAGLLKGRSPEEAMRAGLAVGACSVQVADATTGIPDWGTALARFGAGADRLESAVELTDWEERDGTWHGPCDRAGG